MMSCRKSNLNTRTEHLKFYLNQMNISSKQMLIRPAEYNINIQNCLFNDTFFTHRINRLRFMKYIQGINYITIDLNPKKLYTQLTILTNG